MAASGPCVAWVPRAGRGGGDRDRGAAADDGNDRPSWSSWSAMVRSSTTRTSTRLGSATRVAGRAAPAATQLSRGEAVIPTIFEERVMSTSSPRLTARSSARSSSSTSRTTSARAVRSPLKARRCGAGHLDARERARVAYDHIVATADWHIDPGDHFAEDPDYVNTWPVHCVAGSAGSAFHPNLSGALDSIQAVFRKGEYSAAVQRLRMPRDRRRRLDPRGLARGARRLPRRRRRDRHGPLRGQRARCPSRGIGHDGAARPHGRGRTEHDRGRARAARGRWRAAEGAPVVQR